VLLDVGGDVGALLVRMPASLEGAEIEIRPHLSTTALDSDFHDHESHSHPTHVEVLPRPTAEGFVHCAVFPQLAQGEYDLYERPFGQVHLQVTVTGGQVTQASWPTPVPKDTR